MTDFYFYFLAFIDYSKNMGLYKYPVMLMELNIGFRDKVDSGLLYCLRWNIGFVDMEMLLLLFV